jgi:hypothetical protein
MLTNFEFSPGHSWLFFNVNLHEDLAPATFIQANVCALEKLKHSKLGSDLVTIGTKDLHLLIGVPHVPLKALPDLFRFHDSRPQTDSRIVKI